MKLWIWKRNSHEIMKSQLKWPWNHEYEKDILMKSWIWKRFFYETMSMKPKMPWNHEYEIHISVKTWIWNGIWWNVSCDFFGSIFQWERFILLLNFLPSGCLFLLTAELNTKTNPNDPAEAFRFVFSVLLGLRQIQALINI